MRMNMTTMNNEVELLRKRKKEEDFFPGKEKTVKTGRIKREKKSKQVISFFLLKCGHTLTLYRLAIAQRKT